MVDLANHPAPRTPLAARASHALQAVRGARLSPQARPIWCDCDSKVTPKDDGARSSDQRDAPSWRERWLAAFIDLALGKGGSVAY